MTDEELQFADQRYLVRFAEYEVQRYLTAIRLSDEQHTSAFKWLYGSLLAVNGGLALAALNSDAIQAIYKPIPMALAFAGVCAALMIAKLAQVTSETPGKAINDLIGYWARVAELRIRVGEEEQRFNEALRTANNPNRWVERMGWVSAICFFMSALSLGTLVVFGSIDAPSEARQFCIGGTK